MDRGQSEVIGVILLIAVVTIIATAAGVFVINIATEGTDSEVAPQTNFEAEQYNESTDYLKVRLFHDGGDTVDPETLTVIVDDPKDRLEEDASGLFTSDELTSQDSIYIGIDSSDDVQIENDAGSVSNGLSDGAEIQVIWDAEDADESQILFEETINAR